MSFSGLLGSVRIPTASVLERALEGRELSAEETLPLWSASGQDLQALIAVADELRRNQVGDDVGYVVNRNVNFTNVCVKACRFCAFSRTRRNEEGYFLPNEEVVRRVLEAKSLGATEVCIQAGLAPELTTQTYVDLVRAIKRAAPDIHLHAFSPEEIKFASEQSGWSFERVLCELKEAGVGSLPGTSAEVLLRRVRDRIAPGRITAEEWVEVVQTAHRLGISTTSTLMYGHVETDLERAQHLALLRSIQKETGGFTEFVPLSFVHEEAPMTVRHQLPELREGPTGNEVIRLYAIARLMLGSTIRNIQVSWVKEGLRQSQWLLSCGANDLGGTLMNESISTSAGARHGQLQTPRGLRRLIRDAGRVPVERGTLYQVLKRFGSADLDGVEPLDRIEDPEAVFGSYDRLIRDPRFKYAERRLT